jgi:hypothetical protein
MRLTHQSLSGLLLTTLASAAFIAPALAGESAASSASSTTVAQQPTTAPTAPAPNPSVEEAVQKVRDVYTKICSTKNRASVAAPKPMVPQPLPVEAPSSAPMPQMW